MTTAPDETPRMGRGSRLATRLGWLLGVATLVAAIVITVVFTQRVHQAEDRARAFTEAQDAGTSNLATVLSYSRADLDDDIARARTLLSPTFKAEYDQIMADTVGPLADRPGFVREAKVTNSSVIGGDQDRVSLLLTVAQLTRSKGEPDALSSDAVRVVMVASGESWLIDELDPL